MADCISKMNALAANITFCHNLSTSLHHSHAYIARPNILSNENTNCKGKVKVFQNPFFLLANSTQKAPMIQNAASSLKTSA